MSYIKRERFIPSFYSWTHVEHSDERPLQQTNQNVAPVVLVVGHPGVTNVEGECHQEELDGRSDQARPFSLHPGLDVELHTHTHTQKKKISEDGR